MENVISYKEIPRRVVKEFPERLTYVYSTDTSVLYISVNKVTWQENLGSGKNIMKTQKRYIA